MPLVLTRRQGSGVTVNTPSGPVKIKVTQVQRNQARIGIDCNRDWEINRTDEAGEIEKRYDTWEAPTPEVVTYQMEDLHGKSLDLFVGIDESENPSRTHKVLMGKDPITGKMYILSEEVV
jgi:sRNA-binding carbon storage regulator CsrA